MKIQKTLFCSLAVMAVLAGCQQETEQETKSDMVDSQPQQEQVVKADNTNNKKAHNPIDDHTYGNLHEVDLKHL
ncbi:MAG: hypothetical protein OQJ95_03035 [Kangiella sp.]|nr:hypothetical protein [Kangiella sp.]